MSEKKRERLSEFSTPGAKFPHYFLYKEALLPVVLSSVYYSTVTV
jgi:hypothetical protein